MENLDIEAEYNGHEMLVDGNGKTLASSHTSYSYLKSNCVIESIKLYNVLRVSLIKKNLVSMSQLTVENEFFFFFL